MNKDLTVGKPEKVLLAFCLPLLGSVLFQQLYNIADSLIAGKFIGEEALAAVGNSYEITLIFIAFSLGCNTGCSVIVSQLFGAKRYRDMKCAVSTAMISSAAVCVLLMVFGVLTGETLLSLIDTPENIFADSLMYLDIYILGLPFLIFYNISNGIFSALGDSRTPFIFLAASSTANVAADILFVTVFNMGVAGVAWATFICQGVSAVLALVTVFLRLKKIELGEDEEKAPAFSWSLFVRFASIAVPSTLQQGFVSVGNIIIQKVINGFGSGTIAGFSAAVKLNGLVTTAIYTIGNGMSNFTAQNYGAEKPERIKEGFTAGIKIAWVVCIPIIALYLLIPDKLVWLFMDSPSGEAVKMGVLFLRIVSPFYFVISMKLVADGILRGAGKMKQFMAATFADLALRVILVLVLVNPLGQVGICMAWPTGWVLAAVLSYVFYRIDFVGRRECAPKSAGH